MFYFLALALILSLPVSASAAESVRGTALSVTPCVPAGYAVTLSATSTIVFGREALYPRSVTPSVGQRVFAVVEGAATCALGSGGSMTGSAASFVAISVPETSAAPTQEPASNTGDTSSNPALQGLQSLFSDLLSPGAPIAQGVTNAIQSALGFGQSAAQTAAGGLIYGGRYTTVIPCNGGIFYIPDFVGIPYSGPVTWLAPAPPFLVNLAAPPTPTQCHIGRLDTPLACFVGNVLVGVGPRITFYGSSAPGCVAGVPTPPPPPPEEEEPSEDCRAAICAAANAYIGADTSAGPDNGNLACAWAVNNVLSNAGVPKIDADYVPSMQAGLQSGRGRRISQSEAQCGDLALIVAGCTRTPCNATPANHVGICLNAGCTRVVSNSSSRARFSWFTGPTFAPTYRSGNTSIYQVNCPNSP